jgi:hypothetical protein
MRLLQLNPLDGGDCCYRGDAMETKNLEGELLDYWVARALGISHEQASRDKVRYSTDHDSAAPVIARMRITTSVLRDGTCMAFPENCAPPEGGIPGSTMLIAAARCLVWQKYGDVIPYH